ASRKLYDQLARGWNTWDVQSVAAHVLLPEKVRLHVSVVIPGRNGYTENSLWDHVENFGEHSDDGRYTSVDLCYLERRLRVESSARGDELLLRVTPLNVLEGTYIALEVAEIWGGRPRITYEGAGISVASGEKTLCVRALNPQKTPEWDPVKAAHLTVSGGETAYFVVNSDKSPAEIDRAIAEAQAEWLNETIRADGALGEGITAMRRSLLWNMVYEPRHARVVTPVSRNWCRRRGVHFGDYVLFDWDTFFAAIQYALIGKELAYSTFFSIIEELTPEGMVPNFGCATGQSRDRSEPQVGALCAWRLYQQFKDKWFIESVFEPLLTWNRWRFRERDKNHDGLMELGSTKFSGTYDELKADGFGAGTKQGAMWESGLDNSTMFDRAVFNEELECLEQSYAGLNGLMLADCDLLARMARLLGRDSEEKELTARYDALTARIEAELWSEEAGTYLNKGWDGAFDPTLSLTHFYPMLGGRVPPERQKKLMAHLRDENEFWGKYVVPNIARCDASFPEQEYWRGRIWAPTNFLVGEGLLRMGETETWDEVTRLGLAMFLDCWQKKGIVGENYNAITGEAAENGSSDRFY
ncbi:MAG: trehalase family glycosidase, partial [Clostridia bacterium]|nr:trehalase family glycosidase [Clostridia bacterium]